MKIQAFAKMSETNSSLWVVVHKDINVTITRRLEVILKNHFEVNEVKIRYFDPQTTVMDQPADATLLVDLTSGRVLWS